MESGLSSVIQCFQRINATIRATQLYVIKVHYHLCPWQGSNLRTRFRKPVLYPLSYRGKNTTRLRPLGYHTGIRRRARFERASISACYTCPWLDLNQRLTRFRRPWLYSTELQRQDGCYVRETGLEPVCLSTADFKSAAAADFATLAYLVYCRKYNTISLIKQVPSEGLDPPTSAFEAQHSLQLNYEGLSPRFPKGYWAIILATYSSLPQGLQNTRSFFWMPYWRPK